MQSIYHLLRSCLICRAVTTSRHLHLCLDIMHCTTTSCLPEKHEHGSISYQSVLKILGMLHDVFVDMAKLKKLLTSFRLLLPEVCVRLCVCTCVKECWVVMLATGHYEGMFLFSIRPNPNSHQYLKNTVTHTGWNTWDTCIRTHWNSTDPLSSPPLQLKLRKPGKDKTQSQIDPAKFQKLPKQIFSGPPEWRGLG